MPSWYKFKAFVSGQTSGLHVIVHPYKDCALRLLYRGATRHRWLLINQKGIIPMILFKKRPLKRPLKVTFESRQLSAAELAAIGGGGEAFYPPPHPHQPPPPFMR